jgi:hypothetical protein
MRFHDAVDSGIAQWIPEVHPAVTGPDKVRTCASCGTDEIVSRRYSYLGSWWVNLECAHTQRDDEY